MNERVSTRFAGVVCAIFLVALVFAGAAAPSPSPPPAADEASAYLVDAAHDGSIADAGLSTPLTQAWSITLPQAASYPVVAEGMVFVTSGKVLYALNQATGSTIWSHPIGKHGPGLAYDRGQVFVVNGAGLLSAFDATSGSLAWSQELGQWSYSSPPTAANGVVYTGAAGSGGTAYAIRESDGNLLWAQPVENGDSSSPAVTANGVYVSYACQQTYDFDPLLGTTIWHHSTYCEGGGGITPVVADGHVFVHDWAIGNVTLSASDGTAQGTFTGSAPAVANGVAFFLNGSTLSAVDGSGFGSTDWTFTGDGKLDTTPIVAGGVVYVGSSGGNLYALDAATGATDWSTNVGIPVSGNLAASNGTLVFGSGSQVFAYRTGGTIDAAPSNESLPTVEGSTDLNENEAADVGVWSGLPSSYTYQWELCDAAGANCADILGATTHSYVPGAEAYGQTLRVRVVATNGIGSSDPVESVASPVLGLATSVPALSTAPVVSGAATVGQQLSTTNGTWTHSATSYAYQWQRCDDTGSNCADIPDATSAQYTLVDDDIGYEIRSEVLASNAVGPVSDGYAPSAATSVVSAFGAPAIPVSPADQATGLQMDPTHDGFIADAGLAPPLTQAWSVTLPGTASYPLIVNGTVFVVDGHSLRALDQATGNTIWSDPIDGATNLVYDRGQLFVADSSETVTAVDPTTGATGWSEVLSGGLSPTAANGILYATAPNNIYAVSETNGQSLWSHQVAGDNSSPAVTAQGVYVTYAAQQAYDFDPELGTLLWHHDSCCSGGGGSSPVVADGHVYARDWAIGNVILSASTGAPQGSFDSGSSFVNNSMPAVANGLEFVLDSGSVLTATAKSGLGLAAWTFTGDGTLDTAPIVVGNTVYVGSSNGNLYALDATTGATTWSTNVGTAISGSLAAANGTLIVSAGSHVIAFRTAGDITDVPSNQSLPTIDGPADLSGLEAVDVGIWSGLPSGYSYQWELCDGAGANCADIAGATGASYLPSVDEVGVGDTLRVRIVATNGVGASDPVESAPSASDPLVVVTSSALRRPGSIVSPEASVGQKLSTTNGIWTNDPTSYVYKWQRCDSVGRHCVDIAGATNPLYTLVSADKGDEIRSEVRARNAVGPAAGYVPSAPTAQVQVGLPWPGLVRSPVVSGTPAVGKQLATDTGGWTNSPTSFGYRWQRCGSTGANCSTISSATSSHYTLVAADAGHEIRSEVRASNAAGASTYAPSALTSVVVVAAVPAVVTLPKITGIAKVGNSLSVTAGTWKNSPTQYTYQWFRCNTYGTSCTKIAGATSSSYLLVSADAAHKLVAKVKATNAVGSKTAASKPSAKVLR